VNDEVKKVCFIVNKFSGTGFSPDLEAMILAMCKANGMECAVEYTQGRGHATSLARQAVDRGYQNVVAVGGDGTVNEVAQALLHTPVAMGIIPKGSGNGLARHLGIPVKINMAVNCLFNSETIHMDTFRINGKLSLNVSGIGFDGYIADLFGGDSTRGFQGYTKLVLNEFMNFPEFEAEITYGETQLKKKAFVIAIANSSQYGNNARIAPTASVCDEILNVSVLKKFPLYRLDFIYSFFTGTIDQSAYCESLQVRDVSIKLPAPMSFHIDGEPAGKSDFFKVEMVPASLQMLAPCGNSKV
jgi:YegS/Rv2252/BmrU family lipid kinase